VKKCGQKKPAESDSEDDWRPENVESDFENESTGYTYYPLNKFVFSCLTVHLSVSLLSLFLVFWYKICLNLKLF
jgi:hypothetical protein